MTYDEDNIVIAGKFYVVKRNHLGPNDSTNFVIVITKFDSIYF